METKLLLREKDRQIIAKNFRTGTLLANGGAPRGQSAYEQAVEGGYTGTKEEFEEALAVNIGAIADIADDIETVSENISDVVTTAENLSDIHTVAENITDVNAVATDISNVNTVAGISSDVTEVASISAAVSTVSSHDSEVTLVADNMASVMTTANSITDVQNVASDITNINTVAGISSDVSTVATNATAVNTAATNIAAIIAAPTAATNAANSAAEAQIWAEGTDGQVSPLGGEHSSKGWANIAKQYAESIGAALKYKGSVATYSALPSTGQQIGDFWNVLDTGKNYAWTGTEWDDISGIMDLSAYRTAAAQDLIDATKQEKLVSGTNIKTVNSNSLLGSGNIDIDALPSQTGQSGKFLTTDGTDASWANVDALPSQTGQSGKFLTTNGSNASWANVDALPSQTGQSGKFLTTDGSDASWADIPTEVDNKSVTLNSSDQIQAVGLIDQNNTSSAVKTWTGTKAEYDAIVSKDANTIYNVTDELDGGSVDTSLVAGLGRCSYNYQQLVAVNGGEYTAPANGFFVLNGVITNATNNRLYLLLRNKPYVYGNRLAHMAFGALSSYRQFVWLPVAKGDVVAITAQSTTSNPDFDLRFYYAIGESIPTPEYTPIQYIQGQYNTQYIKSGIIPASGMKLYCKLQNTSSTTGFGWGCRNVTYDGAQMSVNATNQNVVVDWFGADSVDRWTLSTSVATTDIFELTIENSVAEIKKNGTVIGTHTFTPTATVTRELFLTGFNNNGVLGSVGATGRLYEFKLWSPEGDLLLDMTPAKDSGNVACLYNSVNKILYYNQGTGSYTAGPDAN